MKFEFYNFDIAEQDILRASVKECVIQFNDEPELIQSERYVGRSLFITCDKNASEIVTLFAANVMVLAEEKGLKGFNTYVLPITANGDEALSPINVDLVSAQQKVNQMKQLLTYKLSY